MTYHWNWGLTLVLLACTTFWVAVAVIVAALT